MAGDGNAKNERISLPLSRSARIFAGIVGLCVVGGGVAAVFIKNNNGGSIALIVCGAAFLLMAFTGYGIQSLKFGSSELIMQGVEHARLLKWQGDDEGAAQAVENLIEQPPSSPTPLLTGSINSVSTVTGRLSASIVEPSPKNYEGFVLEAMRSALRPQGSVLGDLRQSSQRFDCLLRIDDFIIGVETRSGVRFRPGAVAQSMQLLIDGAATSINGVLIVVNADPNDSMLPQLQKQLDRLLKCTALIWAWRLEDTPDDLKRGVDQLIQKFKQSDTPTG
jgi:hypothetical protein